MWLSSKVQFETVLMAQNWRIRFEDIEAVKGGVGSGSKYSKDSSQKLGSKVSCMKFSRRFLTGYLYYVVFYDEFFIFITLLIK